jgi:hypothetical protein
VVLNGFEVKSQMKLFTINKLTKHLLEEIADSLTGVDRNELDDAVNDFEEYIADKVKIRLFKSNSKTADYADEMTVYYGCAVQYADEIANDLYLQVIHSALWADSILYESPQQTLNNYPDIKSFITVNLFPKGWSTDTIFINIFLKD